MQLKAKHGIENYDFESGVISVIILIRPIFLTINTLKKLFPF